MDMETIQVRETPAKHEEGVLRRHNTPSLQSIFRAMEMESVSTCETPIAFCCKSCWGWGSSLFLGTKKLFVFDSLLVTLIILVTPLPPLPPLFMVIETRGVTKMIPAATTTPTPSTMTPSTTAPSTTAPSLASPASGQVEAAPRTPHERRRPPRERQRPNGEGQSQHDEDDPAQTSVALGGSSSSYPSVLAAVHDRLERRSYRYITFVTVVIGGLATSAVALLLLETNRVLTEPTTTTSPREASSSSVLYYLVTDATWMIECIVGTVAFAMSMALIINIYRPVFCQPWDSGGSGGRVVLPVWDAVAGRRLFFVGIVRCASMAILASPPFQRYDALLLATTFAIHFELSLMERVVVFLVGLSLIVTMFILSGLDVYGGPSRVAPQTPFFNWCMPLVTAMGCFSLLEVGMILLRDGYRWQRRYEQHYRRLFVLVLTLGTGGGSGPSRQQRLQRRLLKDGPELCVLAEGHEKLSLMVTKVASFVPSTISTRLRAAAAWRSSQSSRGRRVTEDRDDDDDSPGSSPPGASPPTLRTLPPANTRTRKGLAAAASSLVSSVLSRQLPHGAAATTTTATVGDTKVTRRWATLVRVKIAIADYRDVDACSATMTALSGIIAADAAQYDGSVDLLSPFEVTVTFNTRIACPRYHAKMAVMFAVAVASKLEATLRLTMHAGDDSGESDSLGAASLSSSTSDPTQAASSVSSIATSSNTAAFRSRSQRGRGAGGRVALRSRTDWTAPICIAIDTSAMLFGEVGHRLFVKSPFAVGSAFAVSSALIQLGRKLSCTILTTERTVAALRGDAAAALRHLALCPIDYISLDLTGGTSGERDVSGATGSKTSSTTASKGDATAPHVSRSSTIVTPPATSTMVYEVRRDALPLLLPMLVATGIHRMASGSHGEAATSFNDAMKLVTPSLVGGSGGSGSVSSAPMASLFSARASRRSQLVARAMRRHIQRLGRIARVLATITNNRSLRRQQKRLLQRQRGNHLANQEVEDGDDDSDSDDAASQNRLSSDGTRTAARKYVRRYLGWGGDFAQHPNGKPPLRRQCVEETAARLGGGVSMKNASSSSSSSPAPPALLLATRPSMRQSSSVMGSIGGGGGAAAAPHTFGEEREEQLYGSTTTLPGSPENDGTTAMGSPRGGAGGGGGGAGAPPHTDGRMIRRVISAVVSHVVPPTEAAGPPAPPLPSSSSKGHASRSLAVDKMPAFLQPCDMPSSRQDGGDEAEDLHDGDSVMVPEEDGLFGMFVPPEPPDDVDRITEVGGVDGAQEQTAARRLLPPQAGSQEIPVPRVCAADPPREIVDENGDMYLRSRKVIGEGAFGRVYLGVARESGAPVAIKVIRLADAAAARDMEREVSVFASLSHINVANYVSVAAQGAFLCIVMEYVSGGSLSKLVATFGPLTERCARRYIGDVVQGLAYLHEHGVAHCDIKTQNLQLGCDHSCKLLDFGSAVVADADGTFAEAGAGPDGQPIFRGTPAYAAPEMALGHVSGAVDVWSLGVSVFEVLTGRLPWALPIGNEMMFMRDLVRGTRIPELLPPGFSDQARDFVRRCLDRDPLRRSSTAELACHPWLRTKVQ